MKTILADRLAGVPFHPLDITIACKVNANDLLQVNWSLLSSCDPYLEVYPILDRTLMVQRNIVCWTYLVVPIRKTGRNKQNVMTPNQDKAFNGSTNADKV